MPELIERIHAFHEGLSPSKVARKYEYLTENAFRFFRGTNNLFFEDLSKTHMPASPSTWICGDLHLENFGSYKGDNRLVYFDINDFDESVLAPIAWELARMITSILVGFDALHITNKEAVRISKIFLETYAEILRSGKPKYIESKIAGGIIKKFLCKVETRTSKELLHTRTHVKNNVLQLHHHKKKHLKIDKDLKSRLIHAFDKWMQSNNQPPNDYTVLDARFRLAGTGSIGIRRYVFLIEKKSDSNKHMLIDMKEAIPSSLVPCVTNKQPDWESQAHRIIYIQKMLQNIAPAQLSTINFEDADYILQELQPSKDRINFEMIQDDLDVVCCVMKDMAMLTASAHLRGIGRKGSCTADELIEFGNESNWQKELVDYAVDYKQKVFVYYNEFCAGLNNR